MYYRSGAADTHLAGYWADSGCCCICSS